MTAADRLDGDPYTAADFAAAALITIDAQRDVLNGGSLEVPGTSEALGTMRSLVYGISRCRAPASDAISGLYRQGEKELIAVGVHLMPSQNIVREPTVSVAR
jgi:hypothetical protein